MGRTVFLTDTFMLDFTFHDVNHYIVEVNYDKGLLFENIILGRESSVKGNRLLKTHMEVNDALDFFIKQDLSKVQNIILIHLSDTNSNEQQFLDEFKASTGKVVYVASPGLEIDLSFIPINP
jgi:phosphoribosyl 1,2-cyclic phosphodiesterase